MLFKESISELLTHDFYAVTFKLKFETKFGESLSIVGSNEQLGFWKEFKCPMKWSPNHVWVTEKPVIIPMNSSVFQYKYILI